ncbi:ABC transporter permease [Phytohabitans sp. ZYX-F-186]|uniref:ABC transporter permease n=1 Tax=Phytohabitans maris TaxID=3071409 RepID=A0ABU0ZPT2_9ACTN|nr:ABC transporter permease [Phytohabitans sp. ZYX-F-186]MDQ7909027.1 ABC transporter permease [Phytohabitans sp. ZYX-F-186]
MTAALLFARDRGIVVLWGLLILLMWALGGSSFASYDNAVLILNAAAVTAVFAAGIAIGALAGVLDLSIPGTAALAGVVCARQLVDGRGAVAGIAAGLAVGVLAGLVNGLLAERGLNPLVVTIGTLSVSSGLALVVTGGLPVSGFTDLEFLGTGRPLDIPAPVYVMLAVYATGWLCLTQTRLGLRLTAVGGNAEAARRCGVPSSRYRVIGFAGAGLCAALGGILTAATVAQADAVVSTGVLFDALTAVALGGVALSGGRGSLPRVLVGALVVATIANGLLIRDVPPYWTTVATGALLIAAIAADRALSVALTRRTLEVPR